MNHRMWCAVGAAGVMAMWALQPIAIGQTNRAPNSRTSIGAALEGGGALGLAHIGVLRWLEEHHVPIDYVAGTSMGGLVAGVYATGMSPEQIRALITTIDWDAVMRDEVSYRDLAYRRKEDREAFPNSLQFGLRNGFRLPGGLSAGQEITFLFDRASLPYANIKSFDDLPIPFRCVATDLNTGRPHVFRDGPLDDALRATMSLPAVFTPVKRGDKLYADGGLLDNLPVDVVKEMGAQIVIAVHLSPTPYDSAGSQDLLSVLDRSTSLMIMANELRSMERADLVVPVDLNGYTSTGYKSAAAIIERGYQAAAAKAPMLLRLAVDEETWNEYLSRRNSRRLQVVAAPERVEVQGPNETLSKELELALSRHERKPLDAAELEKDLKIISGSGRFSRFSYRVADSGAGSDLIVAADEREYGPPFLNVGVDIDGSDYDNVLFSFNGRITALDVGGFRAEWRTDFSLGSIWALSSEYYRPFTARSRWFIAPRVFGWDRPFDLYSRSEVLAEYRYREYGAGFDAGYAINRFSEFRFGYEIGKFHSGLAVGSSLLPTPDGRVGSSSVRYNLDARDNPVVPRRGQSVHWAAEWYDAMPGAAHGFPLTAVSVELFHPVSTRGSVFVETEAGTTFGEHATGLPQFFLGGPERLGAYGTNEIRTNEYFLSRIGYLHEILSLPPLIGKKLYFTSAYELGRAYGMGPAGTTATSALPMDVAAGMIAETFIGPIGIGASVGDRGHRKWYFQVGRVF